MGDFTREGIVALLAGLAVLVLPSMITLVFLLPFAILISMLCLSAMQLLAELSTLPSGLTVRE